MRFLSGGAARPADEKGAARSDEDDLPETAGIGHLHGILARCRVDD